MPARVVVRVVLDHLTAGLVAIRPRERLPPASWNVVLGLGVRIVERCVLHCCAAVCSLSVVVVVAVAVLFVPCSPARVVVRVVLGHLGHMALDHACRMPLTGANIVAIEAEIAAGPATPTVKSLL